MAEPSGPYCCPVCFKTYKRREHLQRHRGSHTSERPHRCVLCNAAFQRTDVLKRHLQTCDGASSGSPSRRRACDRCVRQKKACNSTQPCHNCEKRAVDCQYSLSTVVGAQLRPLEHAGDPSSSYGGSKQAGLGGVGLSPPETNEEVSASSSFEDVHFDDLDALIHEAVSNFPALGGHSVPDDWLNIAFSHPHAPHPSGGLAHPHGSTGHPHSHSQHLHQHQQHQQRPPSHQTSDVSGSSPVSEYRGYSFSFLYDFTSRTGLISSFECATLAQRQAIVAAFRHAYYGHQQQQQQQQQEHHQRQPLHESDYFSQHVSSPLLFTPPDDPGAPALGAYPIATGRTPDPMSPGLSAWSFWLHNPIVIKLQQVVLLVKSVVTVKAPNSTVTLTWSPALEQRCLQFFSPSRFAKFVELYWSVWHPNVNFLHRPTFDPSACKSVLLAAMALIGACVSPDPVDNEDARVWFNCVEEMVFTDDDFCSDMEPVPIGPGSAPASIAACQRKLQALQAAYIVCLYQNWEGTDASKRRIRRHRFSTVVSVARDLGIETAQHPDYSYQFKHDFNWSEYILREELVRIFVWIFLLDTAFVIFNNLPHRMVIKEMRMSMASPDACFQAPTAEDCLEEIHRWMPSSSMYCRLLLREAIECVCTETLSLDLQAQFSHLGPLNLFVIASAFHYMIFQHQNLLGVEGQLVPIRNGLRNWIAVWEHYVDTMSSSSPHGLVPDDNLPPGDMWRRVGFVRYASEYWLLGKLLTDRISSNIPRSRATRDEDAAGSPSSARREQGGSQTRTAEPILDKYDQTSMRQVNDLITGFQGLHVD